MSTSGRSFVDRMKRLARNDSKYTNKYNQSQRVFLIGPGGFDPEPFQIREVLGDGRYRLSRDGRIDPKIYHEKDLIVYAGRYEKGQRVFLIGPRGFDPKSSQVGEFLGLHYPVGRFDAKIYSEEGLIEIASKYQKGQRVFLIGPKGFNPKLFQICEILGHGRYRLSRDGRIDPKIYSEEDLVARNSGILNGPKSRERPLSKGKKRVRWQCGCGRYMYDDSTELRSGAAAELEQWLNCSMRKHADSSASDSQHNAPLRSAAYLNAGSSGNQQTAESDMSLQPLGPTTNSLLASNGNAAVALDVYLEKCWLILCGNMKRGPDILLTQLNLSSIPSDKSLFENMRNVYSNFRKPWAIRSFLRGVRTIRFVQFQLHKSARVDIRKSPDMPPETKKDEYLYEPCDLIPPVGETFMTHWFHHPEEAWDLLYAYSLFPKRRKGELEVDLNQAPRVGWGIQIVEGWLGPRLWLLGLSLFLCGSLAFAICWTILEHDIQGAFGVSAYVVALLTLVVGAAQANLG